MNGPAKTGKFPVACNDNDKCMQCEVDKAEERRNNDNGRKNNEREG